MTTTQTPSEAGPRPVTEEQHHGYPHMYAWYMVCSGIPDPGMAAERACREAQEARAPENAIYPAHPRSERAGEWITIDEIGEPNDAETIHRYLRQASDIVEMTSEPAPDTYEYVLTVPATVNVTVRGTSLLDAHGRAYGKYTGAGGTNARVTFPLDGNEFTMLLDPGRVKLAISDDPKMAQPDKPPTASTPPVAPTLQVPPTGVVVRKLSQATPSSERR